MEQTKSVHSICNGTKGVHCTPYANGTNRIPALPVQWNKRNLCTPCANGTNRIRALPMQIKQTEFLHSLCNGTDGVLAIPMHWNGTKSVHSLCIGTESVHSPCAGTNIAGGGWAPVKRYSLLRDLNNSWEKLWLN